MKIVGFLLWVFFGFLRFFQGLVMALCNYSRLLQFTSATLGVLLWIFEGFLGVSKVLFGCLSYF